jgi:hypothetical protein
MVMRIVADPLRRLRKVPTKYKEVGGMPLIDITCKPNFYPLEEGGSALQYRTVRLGDSLPSLCLLSKDLLGLEPGTPQEGVQVDYHQFHARAVNAPDIWIKFPFSEPYLGGLRSSEIVAALKEIIFDWFEADGTNLPGIAVDCFWGPTHGFLKFGDTSADW